MTFNRVFSFFTYGCVDQGASWLSICECPFLRVGLVRKTKLE